MALQYIPALLPPQSDSRCSFGSLCSFWLRRLVASQRTGSCSPPSPPGHTTPCSPLANPLLHLSVSPPCLFSAVAILEFQVMTAAHISGLRFVEDSCHNSAPRSCSHERSEGAGSPSKHSRSRYTAIVRRRRAGALSKYRVPGSGSASGLG